jgi:anti-anti-sigma factor
MEFKTEKNGAQAIFQVSGRVDTLSSPLFEEKLLDLIDTGEINLIGDCSQLEYVSSSALRVFLVALKTIKRNDGQFSLFGLQPQIHEVFDISGFLDLFQIYDNREKALDQT